MRRDFLNQVKGIIHCGWWEDDSEAIAEEYTGRVTGIYHVPFPKLGGVFVSVRFIISFHSLYMYYMYSSLCTYSSCTKNSQGHIN